VPLKLFLIRHGESQGNASRQWQGWLDVPLTERGREQAQRLAAWLERWSVEQSEPIAAVHSSTLIRAYQTASFLARRCGVPLVLDKRLRERNIGALEGLMWPEVEARYPELARIIRQREAIPALPGGESPFQLAERVWQAVEDIAHGRAQGESVAVVSHGGALNAYFNRLLGRGDDMPFLFRLDNTALSIVEIQDARRRIALVNGLYHLNLGGAK
jgi:broad specificity phosphatase PhoE